MRKLYPWQAAALECGADGSNLVYCAPTSGGKSLVAEVLLLRALWAAHDPAARFRRQCAQVGPRHLPQLQQCVCLQHHHMYLPISL